MLYWYLEDCLVNIPFILELESSLELQCLHRWFGVHKEPHHQNLIQVSIDQNQWYPVPILDPIYKILFSSCFTHHFSEFPVLCDLCIRWNFKIFSVDIQQIWRCHGSSGMLRSQLLYLVSYRLQSVVFLFPQLKSPLSNVSMLLIYFLSSGDNLSGYAVKW